MVMFRRWLPAILAVFAALVCLPAYGQITQTETQKLLASDGSDSDRFGGAVSMDGSTLIVGASADADNGQDSGSAYIFDFEEAAWLETQKLTASDADAEDKFGVSVAIDGSTVIVGAPRTDERDYDAGSVYVFTFDGAAWVETQTLTASDGDAEDVFGVSVAINGNTVIVGALGSDDNGPASGAAYVYTFDGSSWIETQKLTEPGGAAGGYFGRAVEVDGNVTMVGASRIVGASGDNSGSVYVYTRDGTNWRLMQELKASNPDAEDRFGVSVAIDGNTAIVGAPGDDESGRNSGAAYAFSFDGTSWSEAQKLLASDGAASDGFGGSVASDGAKVIVGASFDADQGEGTGSAYAFTFDGTSWRETRKLIASDAAGEATFGVSVAIDGGPAIVGAANDSGNGEYSGAVYVYTLDGPTSVDIDIKPGSKRNPINLRSKGNIPVAILTSDTFDATQVNWETVRFGPSGATERHQRVHVRDADYDGDMDVILHFKIRDTGILCSDTDATLTGETFSGEEITGSDVIKIVKCPKNKKNKKKKRH
jgi:hypothetical protein